MSARFLAVFLAARALLSAAPVLIISIDGLRPDAVTQADQHGLKIPNLRRMMAEGAYAEGVTGVTPTITFPSHTTLITGVWPADHGILGNTRFDPLMDNLNGSYWYASDIRVPTLWSAAAQSGIVVASLNWPASVGAKGVRYLISQIPAPQDFRRSKADRSAQPAGRLDRGAGDKIWSLREWQRYAAAE